MKNLLLAIVIGLCIIAFVKAANPLDSGRVVWLPMTYGTVNGHGYELGLAPTATSYGKNSVAKIKTVIRYDPKAFGKRWSVHVLLAAQYRWIAFSGKLPSMEAENRLHVAV